MFRLTELGHTTGTYSAELSSPIHDLHTLFIHGRIDHTHASRTRQLNSNTKMRQDLRYMCGSNIAAMAFNKCERGYVEQGNFPNGILAYVRDPETGLYHHVKVYKKSIVAVGMKSEEMAVRVISVMINEVNHINSMIESITDKQDEIMRLYESVCAELLKSGIHCVKKVQEVTTDRCIDMQDLRDEIDFINCSLCYASYYSHIPYIIDTLSSLQPLSELYISIKSISSSMANCRYSITCDDISPLTHDQFERLAAGLIIAEMDMSFTTSVTIPDAKCWTADTKPSFTVVHEPHISSKTSLIIPMSVKNRSGRNKCIRISINSSGTVDHTAPSVDSRHTSYMAMQQILTYINNLS